MQTLLDVKKTYVAKYNNGWASRVAVLIPQAFVAKLLKETKQCCSKEPYLNSLMSVLPSTAGFGQTGLYFGAAENFIGYERPIVIMCGFGILGRSEQSNNGLKSRADYCAYVAATRCTFQLIMIENNVNRFGAHLQISHALQKMSHDKSGATLVSKIGDLNEKAIIETQNADNLGLKYLRISDTLNLEENIDMQSPSQAVVLRLRPVKYRVWKNIYKSMIWNKYKLIQDLALSGVTSMCAMQDKSDMMRDIVEISCKNFGCLSTLKLDNNSLLELPDSVYDLDLQEVDLSHNKLKCLSNEVRKWKNLRSLNVSNNCLCTLPDAIGNLEHLTFLDASHNRLKTVVEQLRNAKSLEYLHLGHNELTQIPGELKNSANLVTLELNFNTELKSVLVHSRLRLLNLSNCSRVIDSEISRIGKKCQELCNIDLGHCSQLSDSGVIGLVERCPQLMSLDLSGNNQITDLAMSKMRVCLELKELNLSDCINITDAGISKIGEGCAQLQSLNLDECIEVTDVGITKIGEGCLQLRKLNLEDCSQVTDVGISKIGEGCLQLQELHLSSCNKVTDVGISKIGEACAQLQSLDLGGCSNVTDAGISKIGEGCPQLQRLDLAFKFTKRDSKVTDVGISKVGEGCPQLQSLNLSWCDNHY